MSLSDREMVYIGILDLLDAHAATIREETLRTAANLVGSMLPIVSEDGTTEREAGYIDACMQNERWLNKEAAKLEAKRKKS